MVSSKLPALASVPDQVMFSSNRDGEEDLERSCDSCGEEFDLLLLSPCKGSCVRSHCGCCWFGELVLCFTELTGGKTIFPVLKGSPGGWDPENGSFSLTCQLCQRVT